MEAPSSKAVDPDEKERRVSAASRATLVFRLLFAELLLSMLCTSSELIAFLLAAFLLGAFRRNCVWEDVVRVRFECAEVLGRFVLGVSSINSIAGTGGRGGIVSSSALFGSFGDDRLNAPCLLHSPFL